MKIGFYSSRLPFEADLLENGLAGGSENAFVNLTREWKDQYPEDEIIIYNNNSGKFKEYNGVIWKTLLDFQLSVRNFNLDCLVSLREPEVFSLPHIDAKLKILWSQDICNESGLINLQKNKYAIENIDLILANSQFSYNDLKNGFPNSNIQILKNGYNQNFINKCEKEDIAIWGSTPFRGAQYLLELWPEIYKGCINNSIHPKLKLFGGMDLYNQSNEYFKNLYNELSKMTNTIVCGSISQKELFKEMNKSRLLLYPNTYCETSCMLMIEAMSCDVWPISTNFGALNELIINDKTGNIIDRTPEDKEYKDKFIKYAIDGFINKNKPDKSHLNSWKDQSILLRKMIEGEL